ncbi:MAG: hypothetical protein KME16_18925 [Scytolyngbya sp. HA4215-MV1]|jgi:hypothetical protein|nr:hypothetical protein [Scytolyngbya sp. HA4215-MV1]
MVFLVLPLVIDENQIFTFKFWFNDAVQIGMHYRGELYCRLHVYAIHDRSKVYHLACKLDQYDAIIVLSADAETCSLWGSLRSPLIKKLLLTPSLLTLSNFATVVLEDVSQG